jgi:hypothetical protein
MISYEMFHILKPNSEIGGMGQYGDRRILPIAFLKYLCIILHNK